MDEAKQGKQNRAPSVGARQRRTRRQAAGPVEATAWVREADLMRAHALLESLVEAAAADMVRHGQQGQTNPVMVQVRFLVYFLPCFVSGRCPF